MSTSDKIHSSVYKFSSISFLRLCLSLYLLYTTLSHVRLFVTPWTVAYLAPPSMGFSRQEYCSGLPFPSPGDLPEPGIKPRSPTLQTDDLPSEPTGKSYYVLKDDNYIAVSLYRSQINCCELQIAFGDCLNSRGSRPRDENQQIGCLLRSDLGISTARRKGKGSEQKRTVGEIKLGQSFSGHLSMALERSLFTLGHKISHQQYLGNVTKFVSLLYISCLALKVAPL